MAEIDAIDQRIIAYIQGDLELTPEPFAALAAELGLSQEQLVARIERLAAKGIMRRFGATLRHQQSGFPSNVMVAWQVPEDQVERVGEVLAGFRRVSHCYHRRPCADFPFNLFSMVHGKSDAECRRIAAEMSQACGIVKYELLFSRRELKKTSMRYF